jgi:hypothetical protein
MHDSATRPTGLHGIDSLSAAVGDMLGPPLAIPVAKLVAPARVGEPPRRHRPLPPAPRRLGRCRRARFRRTATTTAKTVPASDKTRAPTIGWVTVRKMAGPTLRPTARLASPPWNSPSVWSRNLPGSSMEKVATARPE